MSSSPFHVFFSEYLTTELPSCQDLNPRIFPEKRHPFRKYLKSKGLYGKISCVRVGIILFFVAWAHRPEAAAVQITNNSPSLSLKVFGPEGPRPNAIPKYITGAREYPAKACFTAPSDGMGRWVISQKPESRIGPQMENMLEYGMRFTRREVR